MGEPGQPTVGILGGGIAGLTAAIAFDRRGVAASVFEQAPRLEAAGVGLQLSPNASRQLNRLGLAAQLDAVATRPEAMVVHRWDDGGVVATMPLGAECLERYGSPYLTVHRGDLQAVLASAVPDGTLELGRRGSGVESGSDAVTVSFADGTCRELDALVGADGLRSVARQAVCPSAPVPSGLLAHRGLVAAEDAPGVDPTRVHAWFGPGQHCVCYPIRSGRELSVTAMTRATDPAGDEPTTAYRDWDRALVDLLWAVTAPERRELHDCDPLPRWSTDRTTLLGDAAHAMLPFRAQGANQAVEDAVVLAACLTAGSAEMPAAIARYESLRRPRTERVHAVSRAGGREFHRVGQPPTDQIAHQWRLAEQDWLFGYRADLAAA